MTDNITQNQPSSGAALPTQVDASDAAEAGSQHGGSQLGAKSDDGTLSSAMAKDGATALSLDTEAKTKSVGASHGTSDEQAPKLKTSF